MQRLTTSFFDVEMAAKIGLVPAIVLNNIIYNIKNHRAQRYSLADKVVYTKVIPEYILDREQYLNKDLLFESLQRLLSLGIIKDLSQMDAKEPKINPSRRHIEVAITRVDLVERYNIPSSIPVKVGYHETR